jgi:hypothetical protein
MALTFYWRCESGTLDGTHDYSAGDTTATNNNTPTYTTSARLVGSTGNGLDITTDARAMFDAASIWTASQGAVGFWVQTTDFSLDSSRKCFALTEASSGFPVRIYLTGAGSGSTDVTAYTNDARTGQATIATSGVAMATGSKYFVTFQWNTSTNSRRVAVYNSSLTLINANEDTSTSFTVDGTPGQVWVGNSGSWRGYFDNVFIGSAYGDATAFVTNAAIESYTSYGSGGASATTRYNSFAEDMADGTIDLDNDTFKVCLVTSSYTPSLTHTQLSDVSSSRVSGTTDVALTSVTWTRSGGTATFDAADTDSLFSSTGTPKYAVIYSDTSTNDKLVGYVTLPDSTTITSGDTLRLVWDAAGIFTLA